MENQYLFPAVATTENETGVRACAAIRLASLQSVRLEAGEKNQRDASALPFRIHLSLLRALASWPGEVGVSLNLVTEPEFDYPLAGRIRLAVELSVRGDRRQEVIAELLARYANLFSLLSTLLPRAEFEAVMEDGELSWWHKPFCPKHVAVIDRCRERFSLTVLPDEPERFREVGFIRTTGKEDQPASMEYLFPWHQDEACDLASVTEALLFHPSPIWLQVRLSPSRITPGEIKRLKENLFFCEELLNGLNARRSILSLQAKGLRAALSERLWHERRPVFSGGCFLCSEADIDSALIHAVGGAISPEPDWKSEPVLPLKGGCEIQKVGVEDFLNPDFSSKNGFFSAEEAACAFRIPWPARLDAHGLPIKLFRTGLADPAILRGRSNRMMLLGHNRHRGHINPIRVADEDRLRHTCIMGQTGTGKSSLLEHMIIQDIREGKGLCFVDPHGDSVEKILQYYPEERLDDLILLDFLDPERVVPFNILAWHETAERDRIIDDLYGWLDLTYDLRTTGGPVFEQYFRGFLRLLMGDAPRTDFRPVIGDFLRLFMDQGFRRYCLDRNRDSQVTFMIKMAQEASGEASLNSVAPYVTSKLNRFELDDGLRLMCGQEAMGLNFREAMDRGRVMLVKLGRGRFGAAVSSLLAGQLVTRFQTAAMDRIHLKPEDRRDFFLYVDEFQNIASKPFVAMLAEARKFRLGLVLANQYADQLEQRRAEGGDSVLNAVLGNVGNITCFRLGFKDAETMAHVFSPQFGSEDLRNLPLGKCYVNLKSGRSNPVSFSLETDHLPFVDRPDHVGRLRRFSNKRYTTALEHARKNLRAHEERILKLLR